MQESTPREEVNLKGKDAVVHTVIDGQLKAVPITKGLSDGKMTEVTGGELREGMELVTDMAAGK
jgi:HlyD family secretion protein